MFYIINTITHLRFLTSRRTTHISLHFFGHFTSLIYVVTPSTVFTLRYYFSHFPFLHHTSLSFLVCVKLFNFKSSQFTFAVFLLHISSLHLPHPSRITSLHLSWLCSFTSLSHNFLLYPNLPFITSVCETSLHCSYHFTSLEVESIHFSRSLYFSCTFQHYIILMRTLPTSETQAPCFTVRLPCLDRVYSSVSRW